jgi:hypothetical protein
MADKFGIVANVLTDGILRTGAKVWVCYCNGDAEHPRLVGLSKGGRIIEKYGHYRHLENFRAKWIPEHLRDRVIWAYDDKSIAEDFAADMQRMWSQVSCATPDGRVLREGISPGEMFKKQRAAHNTGQR